ncbi:MAG: hypothetical protein DHS20C18_30070 [Saprospiraceae bacterium]|nr:MAG: hypothetical protein DHS20C18_30070 [Saprospiraceae bacterium]
MALAIQTSPKDWLFAIGLLAVTVAIGYLPGQSDFGPLISLYAVFFGLYLLAINCTSISAVPFYLGLAVVMRLIMVFAFPQLSDDIYRFIWDGRLWNQGYNPFEQLPTYFVGGNLQVPGLTPELFSKLNSPEYFTIYPPVAQATFAIACWLFPNSIVASALVMKSVLLAFELGSLWLIVRLLRHYDLPPHLVLIYALNPLIILEISGNVHFEGGMIFFLLLAWWLLICGRWTWSAIALALSIATKLLPLMFLPLLIRRLGWKRSLGYFVVLGMASILLFAPLLSQTFVQNFSNSLDLYFRKFEFNASIYYLLRWVGYQQVGYNLIAYIGPGLAIGTLTGILFFTLFERQPNLRNWPTAMLFAITLYLFFTTTVHPWYTVMPLVLCIFTRFRFPIMWTGLIMLTYVNYSYPGYFENLWVVAIEYLVIFVVIILDYLGYEWINRVFDFREKR